MSLLLVLLSHLVPIQKSSDSQNPTQSDILQKGRATRPLLTTSVVFFTVIQLKFLPFSRDISNQSVQFRSSLLQLFCPAVGKREKHFTVLILPFSSGLLCDCDGGELDMSLTAFFHSGGLKMNGDNERLLDILLHSFLCTDTITETDHYKNTPFHI